MTFQFDVIGGRYGGAYPGTITQIAQPHEVISGLPNATTPPTRYGDPVVWDSTTDTYRPVINTDTSISGLLVKAYPVTDTSWPGTGFSFPEAPPTNETLLILKQGYIAVYVCNAASKPPVLGQPVYAQVIAYGSGATAIPVGALSAFAYGTAGADAFAIAGATWAASGVDANGFGVVRYYP